MTIHRIWGKVENRGANREEDMNFCRTAPCLNDLNNILFERKALDFSGAKTKTGCIPSTMCWVCESQLVSLIPHSSTAPSWEGQRRACPVHTLCYLE